MKPKLQRWIQRNGWNVAVDAYESSWEEQLKPAQDRMLEMAALESGHRVVDVACGTGLVTFPALEAIGSEGVIVGTDIAEKMVVAAEDIAAREGYENARFERMDAEKLTLPDASFDVALCGLGLMYFPSPVAALQEMRRILRDGGRASVAVWGQRSRCGWAEIFPIVDARVETDVCPLFFQLGTGDALAAAMEEAGFENVEVERISTTLHYPSAEAACAAAFVGGPVALAHTRFDEPTREAAYAEYGASIEPHRNGSGYKIPGEFVVATGTKTA